MKKSLKFVVANTETIYNVKYSLDQDIQFNHGDFVRFTGKNGSGKTSFFKLIHLNDNNIFSDVEIFYVPQNYEDNIFSGRTINHFLITYIGSLINDKKDKKKTLKVVKEFLKKHEILINENFKEYDKQGKVKANSWDNFSKRQMSKLSGGQKRLLYIIREIIGIINSKQEDEFRLLMLDEPFNDLDGTNKIFALKLIDYIRKIDKNIIIFIITHMPIVENLNKVVELEIKDSIVYLNDVTDTKKHLLKKCDCLFEY